MEKATWLPIKSVTILCLFTVLGCLAANKLNSSQWLGSQEVFPITDNGREIANNSYTITLWAVRGEELRLHEDTSEVYTVTNGCFLAFKTNKDTVGGVWPAKTNRIYLWATISVRAGRESCGVIQAKVKVTKGPLKGCCVTVKPGSLFGIPAEGLFRPMQGPYTRMQSIYLVPEDIHLELGPVPFKLVVFSYK